MDSKSERSMPSPALLAIAGSYVDYHVNYDDALKIIRGEPSDKGRGLFVALLMLAFSFACEYVAEVFRDTHNVTQEQIDFVIKRLAFRVVASSAGAVIQRRHTGTIPDESMYEVLAEEVVSVAKDVSWDNITSELMSDVINKSVDNTSKRLSKKSN